MALGINDLIDPLGHGAVRDVVDAEATFVFHNVTLIVQLGLVHRVEEVAEAVRFEIKHSFEEIRGNRLEIVSTVLVGRSVYVAAEFIDRAPSVDVILRPLEHHVFKEVSEAGSAREPRSSIRRGTTY